MTNRCQRRRQVASQSKRRNNRPTSQRLAWSSCRSQKLRPHRSEPTPISVGSSFSSAADRSASRSECMWLLEGTWKEDCTHEEAVLDYAPPPYINLLAGRVPVDGGDALIQD